MQASNWSHKVPYSSIKPIKFLTIYYFTNMIMPAFFLFFCIYFWPVNFLERVISNAFTRKSVTREKWEISLEEYFSGISANISTLFQRCSQVDVTSRRWKTSNQLWNNVVYVSVGVYNVKQRRINVVFFNVDLNNISLTSKKRCHFQRPFTQRWATSKQRCEYDH